MQTIWANPKFTRKIQVKPGISVLCALLITLIFPSLPLSLSCSYLSPIFFILRKKDVFYSCYLFCCHQQNGARLVPWNFAGESFRWVSIRDGAEQLFLWVKLICASVSSWAFCYLTSQRRQQSEGEGRGQTTKKSLRFLARYFYLSEASVKVLKLSSMLL